MEPEEILRYLEPRLARNPNKPIILHTDPKTEYRRMVAVYDLLAGSQVLSLGNVSVPTRSDIEEYIKLFGVNPLETSCGE